MRRSLGADLGNGYRVGYKQLLYLNSLQKQGLEAEFMTDKNVTKADNLAQQFEAIQQRRRQLAQKS